ncbi:hypothetical protein ACHWQZ_G002092 [Mnemiopsis leidyi]
MKIPRLCVGELFGRRRTPGSRRRAGDRPNTNIKYGVSNTSELFGRRRNPGSRRRAGTRNSYTPNYSVSMTIWYVVIGVAVAFVLALIASIVYYFLVVRKRNQKRKEAEMYKPVGGGYRSKADRDKEMEEYLAHVRVAKGSTPNYDQFVARDQVHT